jgi:glycerol-3-phosphate acyltransferase PlsY
MNIGSPWAEALAALLAYVLGGIPFGWLTARALKGVDLRKVGSGNIGATNASRLWPGNTSIVVFIAVFLLDCFKGFCAANWSTNLGEWLLAHRLDETSSERMTLICGASVILGHVFTPYLRFKGGKGVATTLGVVTALAPWSSLYALGFWGVLVVITRYMSLGSIAAVVSIPITYLLKWGDETFTRRLGVFAFLTLVALVVIWRHRDNLRRIFQGRERRIGDAGQLRS